MCMWDRRRLVSIVISSRSRKAIDSGLGCESEFQTVRGYGCGPGLVRSQNPEQKGDQSGSSYLEHGVGRRDGIGEFGHDYPVLVHGQERRQGCSSRWSAPCATPVHQFGAEAGRFSWIGNRDLDIKKVGQLLGQDSGKGFRNLAES